MCFKVINFQKSYIISVSFGDFSVIIKLHNASASFIFLNNAIRAILLLKFLIQQEHIVSFKNVDIK